MNFSSNEMELASVDTVSSSAERGIMCDKILSPDTLNVDMGDFVWNNTASCKCRIWNEVQLISVCCPSLHSEVETEELRFGEQCVDISMSKLDNSIQDIRHHPTPVASKYQNLAHNTWPHSHTRRWVGSWWSRLGGQGWVRGSKYSGKRSEAVQDENNWRLLSYVSPVPRSALHQF